MYKNFKLILTLPICNFGISIEVYNVDLFAVNELKVN